MVGAGKEAIVFTARYGMQRGAKAGHTVGICVGMNSFQVVVVLRSGVGAIP